MNRALSCASKAKSSAEPTEIDRSSQFLNLHCGSTKAAFRFPKPLGRPDRLKAGEGQGVNESAQFQRATLAGLPEVVEDLKIRFLVT